MSQRELGDPKECSAGFTFQYLAIAPFNYGRLPPFLNALFVEIGPG